MVIDYNQLFQDTLDAFLPRRVNEEDTNTAVEAPYYQAMAEESRKQASNSAARANREEQYANRSAQQASAENAIIAGQAAAQNAAQQLGPAAGAASALAAQQQGATTTAQQYAANIPQYEQMRQQARQMSNTYSRQGYDLRQNALTNEQMQAVANDEAEQVNERNRAIQDLSNRYSNYRSGIEDTSGEEIDEDTMNWEDGDEIQ